jgi:signal peptidase I
MTKPKSKIQEYAEAIVIAILIALFIRTFVVQAFKIPSGSMKPTFEIGDHILVNKFIYGIKIPFIRNTLIPIGDPKRGDIVVFIYPEDRSKDFIKRVIGISGDTIEIRNKKIYLNGLPYNDPYGIYTDDFIIPGSIQPRDNFGPVTVRPDSVFVMGDNRDQSYDSRFWGFVDLKDVMGKAFIIYWSIAPYDEKDGSFWGRFSSVISRIRWKRIAQLPR